MLFFKIGAMLRSVAAISLFVAASAGSVPGCIGEVAGPPDPGDGAGTKSADDVSADDESVDEDTVPRNACYPCYVRCTNAAPGACKWTGVHNIGNEQDCTSAGKAWCSNKGYHHTWAGCSRHLVYPACQ